jgi:hypothetical protein
MVVWEANLRNAWDLGERPKKTAQYFARTYTCMRGFFIQCSLFARARGPTHKSSRAGRFLATIRITAHSHLKILVQGLNSTSTCYISRDSELGALLQAVALIVWDEAVMMHRHVFEAVNRSLQDIMAVINPAFKFLPFGALLWCLATIFGKFCLLCPAALGEMLSLQLWSVPAYGNMCVYSSCTPTCACRGCWLRVGRMHRQMLHGSKHLLITCNVWGRA